jgi:hypothetical protein
MMSSSIERPSKAARKSSSSSSSVETSTRVSVQVPSGPPSNTPNNEDLLQSEALLSEHEEYSNDEKLLNEFTKLHPMLSMESTSARTLQIVASMTEKASIKVPSIPVVSKSHDDQFLSRPNTEMGERECCCGTRCLANFIAKVRYGPDTDKGFICKEYLLPSQYKEFVDGKGLPAQREKCLLCCRYFTNYIYILVRNVCSNSILHD